MRTARRLFLLLFVLALIAAACGGDDATETTTTQGQVATTTTQGTQATTTTAAPTTTAPPAQTGGTIIIGTTDTIASLDPADAYSIHDWELLSNINEGLLTFKPGTVDVQPGLATAMPDISADGLTYTFTLKDGIMFGDGTPLTATDYAKQLNRLLAPGPGPDCPNGVAGALAQPFVESIEAPDASTIVFHLTRAVGFFNEIVARPTYFPADPNIYPDDECVLFPEAPVYGTGPWFISEYTQNEQAVLEPNPYYTGDLTPQADRIIVRYFSDPQTMALAIQNGEIDIAWRFLGPELIGQLQDAGGLNIGTVSGGGIRYLIINHTMAPFDDPNVTKAVASLIDRDEITDVVFGGQVDPLYTMLPDGFLGQKPSFDDVYAAPDVDAAKAYLADSGYDENNHLQIDLWYPPEHYGAETADWMALIEQQLEASGVIDVNLQSQEWSTYVVNLTGGDSYPAGVLGWFFDYPDSSNYLEPFVFNGGEGTNVTDADTNEPLGDQATQLVDLLNEASTETDTANRADLYGQIQDLWADMVVTLPIVIVSEHVVYPDYISGTSMYDTPDTLNIGPAFDLNYSLLTTSK